MVISKIPSSNGMKIKNKTGRRDQVFQEFNSSAVFKQRGQEGLKKING